MCNNCKDTKLMVTQTTYLLFEISSKASRKIQFKQGKNPVHQIGLFKLENCKNHVQIDRGKGIILIPVFFYMVK